jgi:hypothetical protein
MEWLWVVLGVLYLVALPPTESSRAARAMY